MAYVLGKTAKFFIGLGVLAAILLATIFALSIFLAPDNLAVCDDKPSKEDRRCKQADVIVAISGGDTTARAQKAINLYKDGWAQYIIFSGAAADPESPSNAKVMRNMAIDAGVPKSALLLEQNSVNTVENAKNVAEIINENNWRNVILVSENYHLRRAGFLFDAAIKCDLDTAGAKAERGEEACVATTVRTTEAINDSWWWVKPRGWVLAVQETGGIIKFWAKGGKI
ncbi:YdcF family protein [Candidatus Saccharibacteria bacterium]|nr:YdcF family protein [Candidatus Saccharibacteria bacterium]